MHIKYFAFLPLVLVAVPAHAEVPKDCGGTYTLGFKTNDPRPEFGIDLANGEPVFTTGIIETCGRFSLSVEHSSMVSNDHGYGGMQAADSNSVGFHFADSVTLAAHPVNVETALIYHGFRFRKKETTSDDYVEAFAKMGVPFRVGDRWTITPEFAAKKYVPVDGNNPLYWLRANVVVGYKISKHTNISLMLGDVRNINSVTAVPQGEVRMAELRGTTRTSNGVELSVGVGYTTPMKKSVYADQLIAKDAKFMQRPGGYVWKDVNEVTGSFALTRRF